MSLEKDSKGQKNSTQLKCTSADYNAGQDTIRQNNTEQYNTSLTRAYECRTERKGTKQ